MLRKKGHVLPPKKSGVKNRRCSVCKSLGHQKLACPQLDSQADRRSGQIPVRILHNSAPSEHVLTVSQPEKKTSRISCVRRKKHLGSAPGD